MVGKKKSWWGLVVFIFFLQKLNGAIQPRLDQSLKGVQPSISENQHKKSPGALHPWHLCQKNATKNKQWLGVFSIHIFYAAKPGIRHSILGFAVFRFMLTKRKKTVVNPRAHPFLRFFPKTYLQENAIQPRVNQSLRPSHSNPFPEN